MQVRVSVTERMCGAGVEGREGQESTCTVICNTYLYSVICDRRWLVIEVCLTVEVSKFVEGAGGD